MITSDAPAIERAHDIRDLVARTADRPRRIDRDIDYFGGPAKRGGGDETATAVRLAR